MQKSNILVTGGAGFIGSHLVHALLGRGHRVRVLDALVAQVHGPGSTVRPLGDVEFIHGNVRDRATVDEALEGIDAVFHLAAEVGVGQSMYQIERYVGANTFGTSVLLESLVERRSQIRKLIVASSMSIYGEGAYRCSRCGVVHPILRPTAQLLNRDWDVHCPVCGSGTTPLPTSEDKPLHPTSVYAITKQDQEKLCLIVGLAYRIPTVALRFFNVYGPGQALSNPYTGVCAIFSSRLLNGRSPVIFEDGEQARDFVHVSDIVAANLLALERDGADYQAINVGTGVATSVKDVARLLAGGLGSSLAPDVVGKYREGDIRHCIADITRAGALLGYAPKVRFDDGVRDLIEWVRKQESSDRVAEATAELEARKLVL